MIRALVERNFDQIKKYVELAGLSTDSKPTSGIITGSKFYEVDSSLSYVFDEVGGEWDIVGITPDEIKAEIDAWLDDHPEATTTVEDGAISYAKLNSSLKGTVDDVADLKDEMPNKANVDGYYEQMTVGNAEQIVSTVGVEDKVPYLFRTSGGSADIGDREIDKLVGGTVAWNQRMPEINGTNYNALSGNASYSNGKATVTSTGTSIFGLYLVEALRFSITGHKYLVSVEVKASETNEVSIGVESASSFKAVTANTDTIIAHVSSATADNKAIVCYQKNASAAGATLEISNFCCFDLTQMFGSTIADYIYALETATEGAGVAWFRNLFPKPYYAYNAGELISVKTTAHKTVGFNAWDEEWEVGTINATTGANDSSSTTIRAKNKFPVVPGASYNYHNGKGTIAGARWYDASENYVGYATINSDEPFTVPSNVCFMRFVVLSAYGTTYLNDICINLSWDGERDGEYEPYEEHVYALDSDLELRGIPKLDTNNRLYYDGDEYASDGTVTRRYEEVTSFSRISLDSTGKLYKIATATDSGFTDIKIRAICNLFPVAYLSECRTNSDNGIKSITVYGNSIYISGFVGHEADLDAILPSLRVVHELAIPTTESADPFQNPQIVNDFGTEEYVDTRTVPIPVGHETMYQNNLRAKLEMAPESPSGEGDYIVRQVDGENTYVPLVIQEELPTFPAGDGTYILKVTVADGTPVLSWEVET